MFWVIPFIVLTNYVAHGWRKTTTLALKYSFPRHTYTHLNDTTDGQTVYGLSSAVHEGGCGIAVTRITGKQSLELLQLLTKSTGTNASNNTFECEPRVATLRVLYDKTHSAPIDRVITIYFPAPNSFTGEDVVEIHTHGSRAVISQLFATIRELSKEYGLKVRQAERGEFTRRAFYNGKLDLIQAEAIRDVIRAETQIEVENAALKIYGRLSKIYHTWTDRLNQILGIVEAKIEFNEQASTDLQNTALARELNDIATQVRNHINDNRAELVSMGATVAIVGPPNAGKSSLINTICDRNVAIVADLPGTTRDPVHAKYDLNGIKITLVDTAGIRIVESETTENSHQKVEMQGIEMALEYIKDAKVVLFLYDHDNDDMSKYALTMTMNKMSTHSKLIVCISKTDLLENKKTQAIIRKLKKNYPLSNAEVIPLSTKIVNTVDDLLDHVQQTFEKEYQEARKQPFITDARQKNHLINVLKEIERTLEVIQSGNHELEIIAENIRAAISQIAYIVGEQTNEELLDTIFRTFCVGK
eukprot:XP_001608762.1 tRNA modification GTPase TrmE [Babesia bovis T2Bo]